MPITLVICFTFLFYYLGLTFFSGIVVFIFSVFCNICLSKILAKYQKQYMSKKEIRIGQTSECLDNIKSLKLYSYVGIFQQIIETRR